MSNYDVIVFGATGFTGALVAEYLAETTRDSKDEKVRGLTWAIAGRNQSRLEEVKQTVKGINSKANPGIIVADSADQTSIDNMVKQAKIIISTAGPFYRYSIPVVDACVRFKVHYVDITGEAHFIRKIASQYHEDATKNGTYIVPSCGFDSIPSDLTAFLIADKIQEKYNSKTSQVVNYATKVKGGFSGGTLGTILDAFQLKAERDKNRKSESGPRKSVAGDSNENYRQLDFMGFGYDKVAGLWTAPFVMSAINAKAVRKSNELLGKKYGTKFSYKEGQGCKSLFTALAVTTFMVTFFLIILIKPFRSLIAKFGPQPGTGPSKEQRENGYFNMSAYGIAENNSKNIVRASVSGKYDPGYKGTSQMITEAALCLLFEVAPDPKSEFKGGVLTPASAMGYKLVNRLKSRIGMKFDVE